MLKQKKIPKNCKYYLNTRTALKYYSKKSLNFFSPKNAAIHGT